jgi:prepilin-type N-terminal cleavage/methylation domain-containing protein
MKKMITQTLDRKNQRGFTLVELATVIFVIGILVTITMTSFGAIQDRNNYSIMENDLKSMKIALEKYYAKNGVYPTTGSVSKFRRADGPGFIPGLSPTYFSGDLPDVPSGSKSSTMNNTYMYKSDGSRYKLLRYLSPAMSSFESSTVPAAERDPTSPNDRWGYWSFGDSAY